MKLSKRLETIASFVRRGSKIADIGTDHGYVPIRLVEEEIAKTALAMDVRRGPLERAEAHVREHGMEGRIALRLSDGLAALRPGEADCVIIAGMGGELLMRILEEGVHMWDSVKQWVLSPQSDLEQVRKYLLEHGFFIRREAMVEEDGKYYVIMDVGRTLALKADELSDQDQQTLSEMRNLPVAPFPTASWTEAEYRYGRYLIAMRDPVLSDYLKKEKRTVTGILRALEAQEPRTERTVQRLRELWGTQNMIEEAEDEMQKNH